MTLSIKESLKKYGVIRTGVKAVRHCAHEARCFLLEKRANRFLKNHAALSSPIKVAFLVQMPEIWDKQKAVYEAMVESDRFEPWLVVVPSYDFREDKLGGYGAELEFFKKNYPDAKMLLAITPQGAVENLAAYRFDYVFYQRPYEHYLPEELHTKYVVRYARTCYLPYSFFCDLYWKAYFQTEFFRYLCVFFCSNKTQPQAVKTFSLRKNVHCGYPVLESVTQAPERPIRTITWTPRWTEEAQYGGSSFLKFKDAFLSLSDLPDTDIIIRPHPLMFDNFVKCGKITAEDVTAYRQALSERNILLDSTPYVNTTLEKTDILITDFSSIVVNFFVTGKPIIYCSSTDIRFSPEYQAILDCSYIAHNWDDVMRYTGMLRSGEDPLSQKRKETAAQYFPREDSVGQILDCLQRP